MRSILSNIVAILLVGGLVCTSRLAAEEETRRPYFETTVRPILKAYCFHCHGDEDEPQGKLDLRLARWAIAGGESGPAVVAGKHADSPLWQRVQSGEMPPGEKKLTPAQISVIAQWIDSGAFTSKPEPADLARDALTDDDRAHWSFQPIRRPELPKQLPNVADPQLAPRTPIDQFLLAKLAELNLGFSPSADRITILRRLSVNLTGLPPDPELCEEFEACDGPDLIERAVDRWLASPRYGERWARHWLDTAGYADSDGYNEKDPERKYAYQYRDYLVRSLNADRPWNELIVEQLAGDELLTPPYQNLTPDQADKLIATGFLRMAPDGTADSAADQNVARNEVIAETIKIVSTSLLGMTVGCAQCHAHKYDPVSQVDYYRFRAIFEPAYDWKNWRTPPARLVSLLTDEQRQAIQQIDAQIKQLEKQRTDEYQALAEVIRDEELQQVPEADREAARSAAQTAVAKRTPEQKELIVKYPKVDVKLGLIDRVKPKEHKAITEKYAKDIEAARSKRPTDAFAHCLTEVPGKIPPTHLFFRGEFAQPKQAVEPAELAVLRTGAQGVIAADDPTLPTSGRRLAYARHLTDGQHPLVARVLVNRLWLNHFGRGIVATPADFGTLGQRPSHPELLDWLADEFMRGAGSPREHASAHTAWTWKSLHRMIATSTVYRQSSRRTPAIDQTDTDNRWLGRMPIRRLDAESLRDAVLVASGAWDPKLFGPPVPVAPDESGQIVVAVDTRDTAGRPTGKKVPLYGEEFRRGLYVQVRRTMPLGMLETFDAATLSPNCDQRNSSTVAPQSLLLLNSEFLIGQADTLATRIEREASADPVARVEFLWRVAFGRAPTPAQQEAAVEFLRQQVAEFPAPAAKAKTPGPSAEHLALASLCQTIFASNAFLYVD